MLRLAAEGAAGAASLPGGSVSLAGVALTYLNLLNLWLGGSFLAGLCLPGIPVRRRAFFAAAAVLPFSGSLPCIGLFRRCVLRLRHTGIRINADFRAVLGAPLDGLRGYFFLGFFCRRIAGFSSAP